MKLQDNLRRAAACIAAILPLAILALTVAFARHHPHRAPGLHANAGTLFVPHTAPDRAGHLVGWVNHLIGPFTSIAANL